ncbi:unnamed protein product, partial [Discosporangium mesarthrocarpum]
MPTQRGTVLSKSKVMSEESKIASRGKLMKGCDSKMGSKAQSFIVKLASKLAEELEIAADAEVSSRFNAALESLPPGKLRDSLMTNSTEGFKTFSSEVRRLRPQRTRAIDPAPTPPVKVSKGKGKRRLAGTGGVVAEDIVPCTLELYIKKRAVAEEDKALESLRVLAMNPRAPSDLLLAAMERIKSVERKGGDGRRGIKKRRKASEGEGFIGIKADSASSGDDGAGLTEVLVNMSTLAEAVAIDILGFRTVRGQAFYLAEANRLASQAVQCLSKGARATQPGPWASQGAAEETLGHLLRFLYTSRLTAPMTRPASGREANDGSEFTLQCIPKTELVEVSPQKSIACLLAHYTVALVLFKCRLDAHNDREGRGRGIGRGKGRGRSFTDATALVRRLAESSAQCLGSRVSCVGNGGKGSSSDSDNSSCEDEGDEREGDWGPIIEHILCLCAGSFLSWDEAGPLDMLRCIGGLCLPATPGKKPDSAVPLEATMVLAPLCSRLLARILKPIKPSTAIDKGEKASLYLKRAYASRLVSSLFHLLNSSTDFSKSSTTLATTQPPPAEAVASVRVKRSFTGAGVGPVPSSLIDFLDRVERLSVPPPARPALDELVSRANRASARERRGISRGSNEAVAAAAVKEGLRAAEACGPSSLGPLVDAVESVIA